MGLDISVCKIVKEKNDQERYFRLIDDDGNYKNDFPSWTKEFEDTFTETWYDWKKLKEETGIDIDNCEWHGEEYSEKGAFMKLWPKEFGEYPNIEDFKIGENKYDFDAYEKKCDEHIIILDLRTVPTFKKEIRILWYDEVGYQRKGLNRKFYSDYRDGKIGYFVWTKKELLRYKRDYCDKKYEYIYPSGKPSGEYVYEKRNFQRNIIDNFGEHCCVTFDW